MRHKIDSYEYTCDRPGCYKATKNLTDQEWVVVLDYWKEPDPGPLEFHFCSRECAATGCHVLADVAGRDNHLLRVCTEVPK